MSSNLSLMKICEFCGKDFEAKTIYTRYCSHTCNSRHYKILKREEKIQTAQKEPNLPKPEIPTFETSLQYKEFLSINETASLLGASRRTIQRMISKGALKVGKLGRRIIVKRKEIDKLFI